MPRVAVRLLHAGDFAFDGAASRETSPADRRANPEGYRREYLPLHGLSKHFQVHSHGRRGNGETLGDGDQARRRVHGQKSAGRSVRVPGGPEALLSAASGFSKHGSCGSEEFSGETERGHFAYSRDCRGEDDLGGRGEAAASGVRRESGGAGRLGDDSRAVSTRRVAGRADESEMVGAIERAGSGDFAGRRFARAAGEEKRAETD